MKHISLRLPAELVEVLDRHAVAEGRSRSNMAARLLADGLNFTPGHDNPMDPPCGFCGSTEYKRDEMHIGKKKKWICGPCWVILKEDADKEVHVEPGACEGCGEKVSIDLVAGRWLCVACDKPGVGK